ncbi:MAG: hypothetical protein Q9202_006241 [Teloschistes flavicans]
MEGRRAGAKLGYRCYTYQFVLICFNDPADSPSTPENPRITPKDAGIVVSAVKDLYFLKYGTNPREIGVQIKKRGERQQNMGIRWLRDTSSRWPEPVDLPFMVRVRPDRFIQITWYSTDVYPSIARQVEVTLQSFTNEFATEGPLDRPPSKGTYTRTSGGLVTRLSIQIQGPAPGALIRLDMITFLKRIDELLFLPHDWDLREFRADLLSDRGNLGTMALKFDQTSS